MLTTAASLAMGFAFVLIGGINVWLVFESSGRVKAAKLSSRMLALHRIGGYLFIALFCVMSWYMVARLRAGGADTSATVTLHLALAMLLSPLLFIKVLVARYYKNHHGLLLPIGLTIFILAFVLVASTAGPTLARESRIERVSIDPGRLPAVPVDLNRAGELMERRCSKCHNLDRVVGARKDAQGWSATVARMQKMPGAGISDSDVQAIASWLVSQGRPEGTDETVRLTVAHALVDQRCGRCHTLDRVYKAVETPEQWREIVTRMTGYAAGSSGALQPGEGQRIIDYLSATQSPAASSQKRAQADAPGAGTSQATPSSSVRQASSPNRLFDGKTAGFFTLIGLGITMLIVRRPGAGTSPGRLPPQPSRSAAPAALPRPNGPLLLQLVRITQQTRDSKTLRFAVCGPQKLDALPGQFLTFSFLFQGRKEIRCYSICSSPARSGYVEITPKRVPNGCVSVFLNDQVAIGMTVEAAGPFGQFVLKAAEDKKIVLLAAGSGITPMMAMLYNVDDYGLDTEVTLLYCVRTGQDIMFRQELDDLQMRLKTFRYRVLLSEPEPDWPGARGHINQGFIAEHVAEVNGRAFFLCGPPPFMDAAKAILSGMGVPLESIRIETFGGTGAAPRAAQPGSPETVCTADFARSGKRVAIRQGQTILDAAAENDVAIPSGCRQGQCGTCKTRLLEGVVHMSAEHGLDAESKARGFVLTCVGYPEGDVRLDV